jgi:hypothetical protein
MTTGWRTSVVTRLGVAAILVSAIAGCGRSTAVTEAVATSTTAPRSASTPTGCQTFSVSSYSLMQDPKSAIAFSGNPEIFEAMVEQVEPVTKVDQPGLAVPSLIYLPVHVRVTAAYKGTESVGDSLVLRDLGGTAPDCTTLLTDMGYPDDTWVPGTAVFVFANEPTSPSRITGLTPNWVFVERGGIVRSAVDPTQTMALHEMRDGVAQRWPRT